MSRILKTPDSDVRRIAKALERFEGTHPRADCIVYRYNPAAIRIRIVDAIFAGRNKMERHDYAMRFLRDLPEDVFSQISLLLCLEPGELSFMDLEFSDPSQSAL